MKLCPICQRCYEDADIFCSDEGTRLVAARPGPTLVADKYRLDRVLGRGGMGAVYAGTHIELERPIAVKLLLPDFTTDPQALIRFRREARAAARLNHTHVADVYDYGTLPDGGAYIVMEKVDGETLHQRLNRERKLDLGVAVTIARQVADGISAAHRSGIVHRDLKPSNIILTTDHHDELLAKVVDFGIAKLKEQTTLGDGALTVSGSLIGTPRYMSPEQCAGGDLDARSDIYSLGVILYEMVAGRPPFDGSTVTAVAIKHLQDAPPPLDDLRPEAPAELKNLIIQMLAKEPSARPQTAAELTRPLRNLEASLNPSASLTNHDSQDRAASAATSHADHNLLTNSANPFITNPNQAIASTTKQPSENGSTTNRGGLPTLPSDTINSLQPPHSSAPTNPPTQAVAATTSINTPITAAGAATSLLNGSRSSSAAPLNRETAATSDHAATPPTAAAGRATSWLLPFVLLLGAVFAFSFGAVWLLGQQRLKQNSKRDSSGATPIGAATTKKPAATATTLSSSASPARRDDGEIVTTRSSKQEAPATAPPDTTTASTLNTGGDPRAEVRFSFDQWVAATNARDISKQISFYPSVTERYYKTTFAAQQVVRADKARVFGQARHVEMHIVDPHVTLGPDGRSAIMTFRKQYRITNLNGRVQQGEVQQEMHWIKTASGWKITIERDLKQIR